MGMSQLILLCQVAAAVVFTPAVEMEQQRPVRVEKGVKDFFKEEWVERVSRYFLPVLVVVVLVVAVVRVTVEGVVEGIPGEAVGNGYLIPVEEGEVLIMMEKISKMIAVTIRLDMAG